MSIKQIASRLEKLGCKLSTSKNSIQIEKEGITAVIDFDAEWMTAINGFFKARQYSYDADDRILTGNRFAEYQIVRLDPGFYYRVEHKFEGKNGDIVHIAPASKEFSLSYFLSDNYGYWFTILGERVQRRIDRRRSKSRSVLMRREDLFPSFHTIRFQPKRKPSKTDICQLAEVAIKSCLFSLAYNKNESWEINKEIKSKGRIYTRSTESDDVLEIPNVTYESAVVTYYKVAKSSQFPSQVFLSYYHILEYHFLRTADENLHGALRTQLNDPSFKSDYENVSRLISTLKKADTSSDEKEMLRGVLRKYVPEEDFINFVKDFESSYTEKRFSGEKQKIFGESFTLKLESGHALSNVASILKHIRNSIVHSSDRHSREECFVPFSESDELIVRYIPIIQFLAEKVIFATAE